MRVCGLQLGWTAHPVFLGDYPPVMRRMVDRASADEGLLRSRLPSFTPEQVAELKGKGLTDRTEILRVLEGSGYKYYGPSEYPGARYRSTLRPHLPHG